ncbi:hypothetical protein D3C72_1781110 [compost metagenome]
MPDDPDQDGGEGRADQRRAADEPNCHRIEAKRQQVGREQHGNIAITDATQRATGKQRQGVGVNTGWQRDAFEPATAGGRGVVVMHSHGEPDMPPVRLVQWCSTG